jgi:hypothetical protein
MTDRRQCVMKELHTHAEALRWLDDVLLRLQTKHYKQSSQQRALYSSQALFSAAPDRADGSASADNLNEPPITMSAALCAHHAMNDLHTAMARAG